MNHHHILLIFHLLAACVWIGGHLLLVSSYLPKALAQNDPSAILTFEARYERLGMTSLAILLLTGVAMAFDYGVYPDKWFHFSDSVERVVSVKLLLLFTTVAFAISARLFIIPAVKSGKGRLKVLGLHIISVSLIGVLMLIFGSSIRFGGL